MTYVKDFNDQLDTFDNERGPHSHYVLPDSNDRGEVILTFGTHYMEGIACSKGSLGNKAILEATKHVKGQVTPYSIMGRYFIFYTYIVY